MINQLVSDQAALFWECIKIGIVMGAIYDLLRIARKIIKHIDILVHIEDILYWVTCSFIAFGVLYMHNYADIRPFSIIGIGLGAAMYFLTLSIIFMKIATEIINFIHACIIRIYNLILIPVNWIIRRLKIPVKYANKKRIVYVEKGKEEARRINRKVVMGQADIKTDINIIRNRVKK
ncbi:spore cortex biosynthesis protein YabQ [Candidatus Epulonipiscium viviparus]|uniref:spore cortex biosynthesis protein YabQ n=1 Tax=Candidatus Epulonipiscium viviparus TaxID=420336 RepID=UPI00016C08D4|nr:spore cortex biosynthesis protein YabQ [Candidatus Epulopiscium viviparus]